MKNFALKPRFRNDSKQLGMAYFTHIPYKTLNMQFKFSNSRFLVPFQGLVVPRDDHTPYPVRKPRFLVEWSCAPLRVISCCGTALPAINK